jgi:SAM-dependent methyltransferase
MLAKSRYIEPLRQLAAEAYEVAGRRCGTCRDSHALWPYIRLSRTSIGAEREGSPLEPILAELLPLDRPTILIAGAQDTGLLALVARGASCRVAEITVLDRCDTPLEMCRRLSARWNLPIATLHQDLRDLDIRDRFDLVLLHHTLQFVPPEDRITVLLNLARALHPRGRLVHSVNISRSLCGALGAEHRDTYPDWVLEELARLDAPLPEPRNEFRARLSAHAGNRERHTGAFVDSAEVDRLMENAGFSIERSINMEPDVIPPYRSLIAKLNMQRIVKIAQLNR